MCMHIAINLTGGQYLASNNYGWLYSFNDILLVVGYNYNIILCYFNRHYSWFFNTSLNV